MKDTYLHYQYLSYTYLLLGLMEQSKSKLTEKLHFGQSCWPAFVMKPFEKRTTCQRSGQNNVAVNFAISYTMRHFLCNLIELQGIIWSLEKWFCSIPGPMVLYRLSVRKVLLLVSVNSQCLCWRSLLDHYLSDSLSLPLSFFSSSCIWNPN